MLLYIEKIRDIRVHLTIPGIEKLNNKEKKKIFFFQSEGRGGFLLAFQSEAKKESLPVDREEPLSLSLTPSSEAHRSISPH